MPSINYVLVYCQACGERRKLAPERAYIPRKHGDLEWSQFRDDLECPLCKGSMKRAPEYQEPLGIPQGFWPVNTDVQWMS